MSEGTSGLRTGRAQGLADLGAGAFGFLLPIGFSTAFTSPFWTPKAALLLLALPALALLPSALTGRTRAPALCATVLLAVSAVSVALSDEPDLTFFGGYSHGVGLLFIGSLVAAWLLGLRGSERGRLLVQKGLLAGIAANLVFALVQPLVDLSPYGLGLLQQRTPGLMGNPVHLASLFMGGFTLAAHRALSQPWPNAALLAAVAAGVQLTGSRFAFLGTVVFAVGVLAWKRNGPAAVLIAATVMGLAVGEGINTIGHGISGTTRIDEGLGGNSTGARIDTWRDATAAIVEEPAFGHGPGRYLVATAPHRSLDLARRGPERYFRDAHNIVVEWATTIGLLGLAAFGAWIVLAARGASGPLLWFSGGVLLLHLVQPLYLGTTPLAFLALGAAGPRLGPIRLAIPARVAGCTVGALSLLAAAALVRGDAGLQAADLAYSPSQAARAMRYLPDWPEPKAFAGLMETSLSITERDDERLEASLAWYRAAVRSDSGDPRRWNQLGGAYLGAGRARDAIAAYEGALERNPRSVGALTGIARAAIRLGDAERALSAIDAAAEISGPDDPTLRDLRDRAKKGGP